MAKMQIGEALNALEDGHTIWNPKYAQRVCTALGIPFNEDLVHKYHSDGDFKGLTMYPGQEGTDGVYSLNLSSNIARQFGIHDKARLFNGRGSQAREYARVIREELERQGRI